MLVGVLNCDVYQLDVQVLVNGVQSATDAKKLVNFKLLEIALKPYHKLFLSSTTTSRPTNDLKKEKNS